MADAAKAAATAKPATPAPGSQQGDKGTPPAAPAPLELKAPEGLDVAPEALSALGKAAAAQGLDAAKAQALLDSMAPELASVQKAQQANLRKSFEAATLADPEIGGANAKASYDAAVRGLSAVASPAFLDLLKATHLEAHPEFIRTFARVAAFVTPDTPVLPTTPGAGAPPVDPAKRLFPTMN